MPGAVHLIPTPLGDSAPELVLPAAVLERIAQLDYFLAESPKSARAFLRRAGHPRAIATIDIRELTNDTPAATLEAYLAPVHAGRDVGVLSEAGVPGVADPGASLVRIAHDQGLRVCPLVGPSSILLALMASGLDGQRFAFAGYLPIKQPALDDAITRLERDSRARRETQIFIETPYRNRRLVEALLARCQPPTRLTIATDLALSTEAIATRTIAAWRRAPPAIDRRPSVFLLDAR